MTPAEALTLGLSALTVAATGINLFVGLRLSALHAKMRADSAAIEVSLLKQFVAWKDDILQAINGKYVSAALIAEIRTNVGRELGMIAARLDHIDKRCEDRQRECVAMHCQHD